jgi:hypothetical protein
MRKLSKKMVLHRETLRVLTATEAQLQLALGGGSVSVCFTDCHTDATCGLGSCSGRLVCTN